MPSEERWVAVGSIVKPHGVRGEVRVKLYNAHSDVLLDIHEVRLQRPGVPAADRAIRKARALAGGFLLISFDGVADCDQAEALRGSEILVPRDALPPPEPGEFYVVDVIGSRAVLSDGTDVGAVVDFLSFPTTDVLVIESEGRRFDVPLVDDFVESVDVAGRRVVIRSLEGLESS